MINPELGRCRMRNGSSWVHEAAVMHAILFKCFIAMRMYESADIKKKQPLITGEKRHFSMHDDRVEKDWAGVSARPIRVSCFGRQAYGHFAGGILPIQSFL